MREAIHRVLLAEDHDDVRHALTQWLGATGFRVATVPDGDVLDARLRLDRDLPDLVITDVRMRGTNVLRLVERLRADGWQTPVIFMTASQQAELLERARRIGRSALVPKPFELERLADAIGALVELPLR